jgi:hypothetical protein
MGILPLEPGRGGRAFSDRPVCGWARLAPRAGDVFAEGATNLAAEATVAVLGQLPHLVGEGRVDAGADRHREWFVNRVLHVYESY